eukprot:6179877-Pleurochrysis_carterae.AAC.11
MLVGQTLSVFLCTRHAAARESELRCVRRPCGVGPHGADPDGGYDTPLPRARTRRTRVLA